MYFAFYCLDKPGQFELRKANRAAHLDYVAGFQDRLLVGGPFKSDDGDTMVGSLLIMDFDSLDEAREFAAGDPYAKAGLFESVDIRPWMKVLG
jgi:uncharacterized protein YciI